MLAKHAIINRKKRKSKKKFSSVKRALAKNAVNATRQSTVKTVNSGWGVFLRIFETLYLKNSWRYQNVSSKLITVD